MAETVLPGTYVTVRDEALISAGRVISGNIGIVGTAATGTEDEVKIIGSFSEAKEIFGDSDAENKLTLIRALEQIYNNGGRTVYALRTKSESANDYKNSLAKLENEIVNIVLLAGQDVSNSEMVTNLIGHLNTTAQIKRERIGIIGSSSDDVDAIATHTLNHERLIFTAPGIQLSPQVKLSGGYTAAAVAGLIASLPVQTSGSSH